MAYPADYPRTCLTDVDQICSYDIGLHAGDDDQSDVRFEITQGTLLW